MELTEKQKEAVKLLGLPATHCLLFGGSRSGKTFTLVRAVILRALAAPKSRHAILRYRFNHVKSSVILDTFPKVMGLCFPGVKVDLDKTDWYAEFTNGSQIWFGGLDDKERTEKILGQEYATIYLNECSQIPYSSRNMAVTRLAQNVVYQNTAGNDVPLRLKMYYDCNPPSMSHWTYKLFVKGVDPEDKKQIMRDDYASMVINPTDNTDNLPAAYIDRLMSLPARMRTRFMDGKFSDDTAGALWHLEQVEMWRKQSNLPDMQRVVVGVDPSGSRDLDNAANDAIGIIVAGLGVDGIGYVLEDLTCKAGPATWGAIATMAYDRHRADRVVGEENYGGAMVEHVIQTARKHTPYKSVKATRNKVVRAEPIAALAETGKIRHAGFFDELEDELLAFTTHGYTGENSPNRVDAYVWAFTELFGEIVSGPPETRQGKRPAPNWRTA